MVLSKDIKFAICFGLIIGALFSFCSLCFASETEIVSFSNVPGTDFSSDRTSIVESSSTTGVAYFQIEPGYRYHIVNNSSTSTKKIAYSSEIPAPGVSIIYLGNLSSNGGSYDFNGSEFGYMYFDYFSSSSQVVATREPLEGMNNFIDNITYSLSFGNLSSVWVVVVPILAISVLFGLGFYFIKRIINKTKRTKGGV